MQKVVTYYRVSTKKQGESGLGLDGQRTAVARHVAATGGKLVAEYVEIESGKRADRPELLRALQHAKSARATLVVAKLDRLARNVAFTSALMETGVEFVACDNPHANKLTIHILAAIAEHEAKAISERTKAALAAAKARGTRLGSARQGHWDGREDRRQAGALVATKRAAKARSESAKHGNALAVEIVCEQRTAGAKWQAIADKLNGEGHVTRRGNAWTAQTVFQLAKRECR